MAHFLGLCSEPAGQQKGNSNNKYLPSIYFVPGTALNALRIINLLNPYSSVWAGNSGDLNLSCSSPSPIYLSTLILGIIVPASNKCKMKILPTL